MPNETSGLIVGGVGTNVAGLLRARGASDDEVANFAFTPFGPETWPQAAIIREDNREAMNFASLQEEIQDDVTPNYVSKPILGRSEPLRFYANTGPRTIQLSMEFFGVADAFQDVQAKVNWIRALAYPRYLRNVSLGPPVVHLIMGQFLQMRAIVSSAVSVAWKAPFKIPELYPQYARVMFTLESAVRVPRGSVDVRVGY